MSGSWIEYQVQQSEVELEDLLLRFGHIRETGDDPDLIQRVWMRGQNKHLWSAERTLYRLVKPEKVWLPPRAHPPGAEIRQYRAMVGDKLSDVCKWILNNHDPYSEEPSAVDEEMLSARYLYSIFENIPVARKHAIEDDDVSLDEGDMVHFFVRPRPPQDIDAAPFTDSPDAGDNENALVSGWGVFIVTIALEMSDPIMTLLEADLRVVPDQTIPDKPTDAKWTKSTADFRITIQKKAHFDPLRTRIRVLTEGGTVVHEEVHTDELNQAGSHLWKWDGVCCLGDQRKLDTRILRSRLIIEVEVEAMGGLPGRARLQLDNRGDCAKFADFEVDLVQHSIGIHLHADVHEMNEDPALWITVLLALLVAIGAIVGIIFLLSWFTELREELEEDYSGEDAKSDREKAAAGAAIVATVIALAVLIFALVNCDMSDEEIAQAKSEILTGIRTHWTRSGQRAVPIDGVDFDVRTTGHHREEDAVPIVVMKELFPGQRGVNLSMIIPVLPVITTWTDGNAAEVGCTGAHELGHTVLACDVDTDFSIQHKGTSGNALNQSALPTSPTYLESIGAGDLDLMRYYRGQKLQAYTPLSFAAEEDVLRILRTARVEWREA